MDKLVRLPSQAHLEWAFSRVGDLEEKRRKGTGPVVGELRGIVSKAA